MVFHALTDLKIKFKENNQDTDCKEYLLPKINKIDQPQRVETEKEIHSFENSRFSKHKFTENPYKNVTLSAFHKHFEQYFKEKEAQGYKFNDGLQPKH